MNKVKKLLPIFILFFFLLPFSAHAASKYYNNATADGDWNNAANWWNDAGFSIPGSVPGIADDAYVTQNVFSNSGAAASVNSLDVDDSGGGYQFIPNITVSAGATFSNTAINLGAITGSATFNNTSINLGTVSGTATFNNTSYNDSPGIVVTGVFNNTSYNNTGATVSGAATFNATSYNLGTVTTSATFNGTSYNGGTVSGTATFDTTYYNASAPTGGVFTISGTKTWMGNVAGNIYGSDAALITSFVFTNTSHNDGTLHTATQFNGSSYNTGTISASATFNTTHYNASAPSGGVFTISGANIWYGNITGTLYGSDAAAITSFQFTNTASNFGYLYATTTFNNTSYNQGTITGDAIFYNTAHNDDNGSGAVITRNAYFYNSSYNNTLGTIQGDGHFYNSAYNDGTISVNAYVYCPTDLPLLGAGTVLGSTYHVGCTYYFNGAVDGDWNTQGNWWDDSGFTVQSTVIPSTDDLVIASASISSNSGAAASINTLTFNSGNLGIDTTVSNYAIFNGNTTENNATITGTKKRRYTSTATITRDFVTTGPWTVIADGSGVVVNVSGASYNGGTTFVELNGGLFDYTVPATPSPSPSTSPSITSTGSRSRLPKLATSTILVITETLAPIIPNKVNTDDITPPFKSPSPSPFLEKNNQNTETLSNDPVVSNSKNEKSFELPVEREGTTERIDDSERLDNLELVAGVFTFIGLISFSYASISNLISTYLSNTEFSYIPNRLWHLLLGLFGFKRKNRPWGTVYDSVTKQPLDPAVVTLFDEKGNEVKTAITDLDGRYGFVLENGTYTISAGKTNYTFPSKIMAGMKSDELYSNLYFGEKFTSNKVGDLVIKNIPMDQENFDWNEYAKRQANLMHFFSKRTLWVKRITDILFLFGLISAGIILFFVPNTLNTFYFVLYIGIFILHMSGLTSKSFGFVKDKKTGLPITFGIVSVYSDIFGTKMVEKVTDKNGRYYCLVPNGKYYVTIQKKNKDGSYTLEYKSSGFEVKNGVIRNDFEI
jgi:hypothetical protein